MSVQQAKNTVLSLPGYHGTLDALEVVATSVPSDIKPISASVLSADINLTTIAAKAMDYLLHNPLAEHNYECRFDIILNKYPPSMYDGTRDPYITFGDTETRMYREFIPMREMSGRSDGLEVEQAIGRRIMGYLHEDGLAWVPPYALNCNLEDHEPCALSWTAGDIILRLLQEYAREKDAGKMALVQKLVEGMRRLADWDTGRAWYPGGLGGWRHGKWMMAGCSDMNPCILDPIASYIEISGDQHALDFAAAFADGMLAGLQENLGKNRILDDGSSQATNCHLSMRAALGILHVGVLTRNSRYIEWARRAYDFMIAQGTDWGWVPEIIGYGNSETCGTGDMADMACWLAKAGYTRYWDDLERFIRNYVREAQFFVTSEYESFYRELHKDNPEQAEDGIRKARDFEGGFVARLSPNSLVCTGDVMSMMGCCPPEAMRALHIAWRHVVTESPEGIFVNLSFNRDTPQARVISFAPDTGRLAVVVKKAGHYFLRPPSWTPRKDVKAYRGNQDVPPVWKGDYVRFENAAKGEELTVGFPVLGFNQTIEVAGQKGKYVYGWKGNTVTGVTPTAKHLPLFVPVSTVRFAPATVLRGDPMVIMSYDYDDWSMNPVAIDTFLDVLKTTGFARVHWRVAHEFGFLYRSKDTIIATGRLDSLGGPYFDPVVYGVQACHKRGLEVYSYVDDWENMGFLGKWGEEHPGACMMTRGGTRWTGGISYAYPEGRAYRLIPARETAQLGVDGVYLENFSWHGGDAPSSHIGFEPPVAQRYKEKYGIDILTEPFELVKLKAVQGEFYRQFLIEAKKTLKPGQRLAFSYSFSQTNEMYHLPILDLKGLVSDKIIDDLILGVWFGTDYECWLTQEGWDKAKEWADFCHKNNAKFFAYIYTDWPYMVAWERFGAPGVRARWLGDHGWLANTGVDGFTNRNVPECICSHGAPGTTNREKISKYLVPVGEQLWSGAAEGIKARPGSLRPLWTPQLPKNAPAILVLMPASVKKMSYPLSHQADYWPETYKGMARQYRTLFTNLGCRMELANTQAALEAALAKPKDYLAIVLAHQCENEPWVKDWLEKNNPQLLDYVKAGGALIAEAGFTSSVARMLDLTSEGGVVSGNVFNIPQASLPVDMKPFLPVKLDPQKNIGGYSVFRGSMILPDVTAPSAYNPALLPGWAVPVATLPNSADDREWPVVITGNIGKGRVLCTTTFLLVNEMVTINPADGPDVPEVIRFWQAIGHWLQPGRKLPIDAAMVEQDRRFAQMAENPLANGGFEEGLIMGHPAYWMAEGKQQADTWIKNGQGVSLDRREKAEGKQSLCLDIAKVASLTSLTFPVRPDTAYILSGKMKAEPRTMVSVKVFTRSGSVGEMYGKPEVKWSDFQIKLKPMSKNTLNGPASGVTTLWVEVGLPGADGKIWLDDFRITEVK